jgi:hypothetical protein
VTSTDIYLIEGIGDATPTVTSQHTFATATAYRSIHSERGTANFVFVNSYYTASGSTATVTTDGSTWTEYAISTETVTLGGTPVLMTPASGYDTIFSEGVVQSGSYTKPVNTWKQLGFPWNRDFEVIGCIFTYTLTGGGGVFKRMSPAESLGGALPSMWDNTSDSMATGTYVAVKSGGHGGYTASQIRDALAPGATLLGGGDLPGAGHPCPVPADTTFWTGFNQGWSQASTFDFTIELIGYSATPPTGGTNEDAQFQPTGHVFGKQAGKAYATAYYDTGSSVIKGRIFETGDSCATWSVSSIDHDLDDSLGGCLHVPWAENADETRAFWGAFNTDTNTLSQHLTASGGGSSSVISTDVAAVGPASLDTCPLNALQLVRIAQAGNTKQPQVSLDGGLSFAALDGAESVGSSWTGCATPDTLLAYLWGDTRMGYSADLTGIDDRSGNLAALGVGRIVGIAGFAGGVG